MTNHDQRLLCQDSGRYQSDPIPIEQNEIGMDEGNYLVPRTKETPAIHYTPVIIREYSDNKGNEEIFLCYVVGQMDELI